MALAPRESIGVGPRGMMPRQRGEVSQIVVGLFTFAVGVGLLSSPAWSATLPPDERAMVIVLGTMFTGIGAYAAMPGRWSRARTLAFAAFMGAFGLACAALALAHNQPDGSVAIAGVPGFVASAPMPLWARLVAAFFALVCLGACAVALWGLVSGREGRRPDADDPG
jgi:hypothetical protein